MELMLTILPPRARQERVCGATGVHVACDVNSQHAGKLFGCDVGRRGVGTDSGIVYQDVEADRTGPDLGYRPRLPGQGRRCRSRSRTARSSPRTAQPYISNRRAMACRCLARRR